MAKIKKKSGDFNLRSRFFWSWMRDSNSRPHDYESGALPAELIQHFLRKLSYITTRELFRQLFSFSPNPAGIREGRGELLAFSLNETECGVT